MDRAQRDPWIIATIAMALAGVPVEAQVTGPEECPATVGISGGSGPDDRTIHRCSLDRRPSLLSSLEGLPAPLYRSQAQARMTVVINPDGQVNTRLTQYRTVTADSFFHRRMLEAVRRLEFEVGTVDREAVRYGHDLVIRTGRRSDTIPERLNWRLVPGVLGDSLVGTWEETAPDPPLSAEQVASIARSVTRVLRDMHVLVPEHGQGYCFRFEGPEREAVHEAVRPELSGGPPSWVRNALGPPGCEFDVRYRRYRIEAPVQTGGGRSVVQASGDFLLNWPPGFDGRWWRAWTASCVAPESQESSEDWNGTDCEVQPVRSGDRSIDWPDWDPLPEPADELAPVQVLVEVTTIGAFRTDTIRSSISEVPRLEDRTVFRGHVRQCRHRAMWSAETDGPTEGEFVMAFRLPVDSFSTGDLHLTRVRHQAAGSRFPGIRCAESDSFTGPMALFTLGGVGEPLRGPVRFCVNEPECALRFHVEPRVHELASEPHVTFTLGDIREAARRGDHVRFRLRIDRMIEGLVPFVLILTPDAPSATMLREHGGREFEFAVIRHPPFPPETEFLIYLATIGRR